MNATERITDLWMEGKDFYGINLVDVLSETTDGTIKDESIQEIIAFCRRGDGETPKRILEALCDEYLDKHPKLIQLYLEDQDDEKLDDPRRGQAESINRRAFA
jgi:hypothetical protein